MNFKTFGTIGEANVKITFPLRTLTNSRYCLIKMLRIWFVKVWSHFKSTSAFAFSKIIEAIARKPKQRMGSVLILCVNINIITESLTQTQRQTFDVDAKCEQTLN